jgi:hypothetical protein
METPSPLETAADRRDHVTISRRDYDDEQIVVVDFGRGVDASLDVVGNLAIVVAGDQQYEFEIPPEATDVTVNDGILQIRR